MPSQDNIPNGGPQSAHPTEILSLAEVANQLSPAGDISSSPEPEVVFVKNKTAQRIIEVTVTPPKKRKKPADGSSPQSQGSEPSEVSDSQSGVPLANPHPRTFSPSRSEETETQEARFAFDPFALEVDGPIPVMPTLPIVDAIEMTQNVVSRKKAGTHYAWRLKPGPYPDLGNTPEIDSLTERQAAKLSVQNESEDHSVSDSAPAIDSLQDETEHEDLREWSEMEVVSELVPNGDIESLGDSFVVQPGEVISIDGNQGYDHIDLRSYDIEDATFQPGAILLSSELLVANEHEETPAPITIRHRGVAFAIFKGEVRVEL